MNRQIRRITSATATLTLTGILLAACSSGSATTAPATAAPATAAPATAAPATAAPATAAPATAAPATAAPSVATACNGQGQTYAVVFYTKAVTYFNDMIAGMQDKAKELGVQLDFNYANFNVTEEYNLLQNALTKKPSGVILGPLDPAAFVPLVKDAKTAGIPLITVGDDIAAEGRADELSFVGPSFEEMGARKAQWIADKLGSTGGTVIVIHGPRGVDFVEGQKRGYESVFKNYPNIKVIEGPYGNISSDIGLASTENMLTANPNPSVIMYDTEDLAVGGIKALQERQVAPGTILMVTSDGTKPGIDAVRAGTLDVTVSENAYLNGKVAVETLCQNIANGVVPPNPVPIELVTITKENIDSLPADILPPGQQ